MSKSNSFHPPSESLSDIAVAFYVCIRKGPGFNLSRLPITPRYSVVFLRLYRWIHIFRKVTKFFFQIFIQSPFLRMFPPHSTSHKTYF